MANTGRAWAEGARAVGAAAETVVGMGAKRGCIGSSSRLLWANPRRTRRYRQAKLPKKKCHGLRTAMRSKSAAKSRILRRAVVRKVSNGMDTLPTGYLGIPRVSLPLLTCQVTGPLPKATQDPKASSLRPVGAARRPGDSMR